MPSTFRRGVTGHDETAIIVSDAPTPRVIQVGGPGGPTFYEVWSTGEIPALIRRQPSDVGGIC